MKKRKLAKQAVVWGLVGAMATSSSSYSLAAVNELIEATEEDTAAEGESENNMDDSPDEKQDNTGESTDLEENDSAEVADREEHEDQEPETDLPLEDETDPAGEDKNLTGDLNETRKEKSDEVADDDLEEELEADLEADDELEKDIPLASTSNAEKKEFSMEDMPEIGSDDFTDWFFENVDQPDLWKFVLKLLDSEDAPDYENFMVWVKQNEVSFAKVYEDYVGNQISVTTAATGDLWSEWLGAKMSWSGTGSRLNPYKITSLSELMGLSEAVAQGESYKGKYFELQTDIDLEDININKGCWNPIGWYKTAASLSGAPTTAFEGTFDGAGNTISGLKFTKIDHDYSYLGLFGFIKNATIKNLVLEAEEVSGQDNVALLAGCVEGNSTIYNVTVSGAVYANGDAGTIAGEITGGTDHAVIENCTAENVVLNSEGVKSFAGGIAGNAQKTDVVDCSVFTQDGDSDRIRGKGYVGGIIGRQNESNVYNAFVTGTIGGNLTLAVGGITGLYESGDIVVAQMDGEISRTNNGAASLEGAIIGTRESRNTFRYGTGKRDNFSYLFVNENNKSLTKSISGSGIADDNTYTYDAHIGYYTDYQKKYILTAGTKEQSSGERFFYEELEDGIKYIITQKLGKSLNVNYADGSAFKIDHYAPGNQGEPVRGYLVSIPRIDTINANGTYDNDVATLTAISATNNSYYRQIDKDSPSAVAPGCTVTVTTAAKNKDGNRYQMVYDAQADGKVKPPTYTDEDGDRQDMTYMNGGSYSFIMPEADTELNVEYVKVTTSLSMTPDETTIQVRQIRSGDRKNPQIVTEVRNAEGTLIAKYINGNQDNAVQVLPVAIHAEHNGVGSTADRTVTWSIDDTDLLHFENGWVGGYTTNDAKVIPNMDSAFIQNIINRKVQEQVNGGYKQAIDNTIYTDTAVVTAATNPSTSVDNKAVSGTCKVNVTFQIVDQTTVRVEGLVLNHNSITMNIVRKLTGDRKNPKEEYIVTEPISLDASLNPSQPFYKNVTWSDTEAGKLISMTPSGNNQQSCAVAVQYDPDGKNNPAWIQNIINADNSAKTADGGYRKLDGSGSCTETVTATSEDQTHGDVTAECRLTLNFRTDDQTVIHPEGISLSKDNLVYDLAFQYESDEKSALKTKTGFGVRDILTATVIPNIEETDAHKPYNRSVKWSSSDPDALTVKDGTLTVNDNASWIQDVMKQAPYKAEKHVTIMAVTEDGEKAAQCVVTLRFQATLMKTDPDQESFEIVLRKTGRRSSPALSWSGVDARKITTSFYGKESSVSAVYTVNNQNLLTVAADGTIIPTVTDGNGVVTAEWIKNAMNMYPYSAETSAVVTVAASDGSMKKEIPVKLKFSVKDETYSGGSSGGGGGGGGSSSGGGHSSGSASVAGASGVAGPGSGSSLPSYVVRGSWSQDASGRWQFSSEERIYKNEWAAIYNPYADAAKGQSAYDWFRFDENGYMVTGWFVDPADGNVYYLNTVSDNTLGRMMTGWQWIDGNGDGVAECYYLNPDSDGTRGRLIKNTTTSDGYVVNENGQWTVDGVVQKRSTL